MNSTTIIGNFKYDYRKKIDLSDTDWTRRWFQIAHTKMECDREVWSKVEELILSEIKQESFR